MPRTARKTLAEQHQQDVDQLKKDNVERQRAHYPSEVHATFETEYGPCVTVDASAGMAFITVDNGDEVRLVRDDLITLLKHLNAAFQVVA